MPDPRISTASPQPLHVPIGCCPSFVNPRRCEDVPVEAAKLERARTHPSRVGLRAPIGSGVKAPRLRIPQPDGSRLFRGARRSPQATPRPSRSRERAPVPRHPPRFRGRHVSSCTAIVPSCYRRRVIPATTVTPGAAVYLLDLGVIRLRQRAGPVPPSRIGRWARSGSAHRRPHDRHACDAGPS